MFSKVTSTINPKIQEQLKKDSVKTSTINPKIQEELRYASTDTDKSIWEKIIISKSNYTINDKDTSKNKNYNLFPEESEEDILDFDIDIITNDF